MGDAEVSKRAEASDSETHREILIQLLEKYKLYKCLWDKTSPEYANKEIRRHRYEKLLILYKKIDKSATIRNLKNKLENMRTAYKRELKKVHDSHKSNETDDIYVPHLWYFDYFLFLDEKNILNRIGTDIINVERELQMEYTQLPKPPAAKRPRNSLQEKKQLPIQPAHKLLATKEENWGIIGRSIGLQLQELSAEQQTITQKIIADAIFYGKLGKLTEHSHINLTVKHLSDNTI